MFMQIAQIVAQRGTCDRAKVGAVIVRNNRIVSIGYNGAQSGQPHCDEVGHKLVEGHCTNAIHAEVNALWYLSNLDIQGPITLYVTHHPCPECMKYMLNYFRGAGYYLSRVVYGYDYRDYSQTIQRMMLEREDDVKFEQFDGKLEE
jgi:dCMP deaminase